MRIYWPAILLLATLPGCVIVQVGVTNPIPGLTTVAVAPFFNLSQEPGHVADGRRMALAYYAELQKTPGFQVIPVGVVEDAIETFGLQMNRPDDALRLCEILRCDAVVVGAITDYDPYYPPRLGVQVSWYSPYPWDFDPGLPVDPHGRSRLRKADIEFRKEQHRKEAAERRAQRRPGSSCDGSDDEPGRCAPEADCAQGRPVIRGQSEGSAIVRANGESTRTIHAEPPAREAAPLWWQASPPSSFEGADGRSQNIEPRNRSRVEWDVPEIDESPKISLERRMPPTDAPYVRTPESPDPSGTGAVGGPSQSFHTVQQTSGVKPAAPMSDVPRSTARLAHSQPAVASPPIPFRPLGPPVDFDPRKPLMSYTRIYDAKDAALMAMLRDYLELGSDLRSGGWEGALHRSDDFLRFCAHQLVLEMLTLHGGESQKRIVLKLRRYH